MTIFLILLGAIIVGAIGLGVGFIIFITLQRCQVIRDSNSEDIPSNISDDEQRRENKRRSMHPMLMAFIAMICSIFVICVLLLIAYFTFIVWAFKDFTLF